MAVQWNVYESFQALLQAGPYHLALEGILILWIVWLLNAKSSKKKNEVKLSKKEEEQLIAEWEPEPLISSPPTSDHPFLSPRILEGKIGKYITCNGKKVLNLGSHNYLNMSGRPEIEETAIKCLDQYGVGSCGPRGFFGTTGVHLEVEGRLAEFFGCEMAVLYSYGFSTLASAIPAYSKRGDVIFVDECVNFAIQRGLQASRSKIQYFRHNDVHHLEELLQEQERLDKKDLKKAAATRRFLVIEGIYMYTGQICPLPELVELRQKYKLRLFLDESCSFGVLGPNAKGVTDYYKIPLKEIDLLMASLETTAATTGGFCVGTKFVIEHQRLNGLGYCFSASLPPMLAAACSKVLDILEVEGNELVEAVNDRCHMVHNSFKDLNDKFILCGHELSPVKHLRLKERLNCREKEEEIFRKIIQMMSEKGVALVLPSYLKNKEVKLPPPSIRLAINKDLTDEEIRATAASLRKVLEELLP